MWKELKWYLADKDYSFSLVKCIVIAKNGNIVIRDYAKQGEYYILLPLIKNLPKYSHN